MDHLKIPERDRHEIFGVLYAAIVAALDAYDVELERERRRLNPRDN